LIPSGSRVHARIAGDPASVLDCASPFRGTKPGQAKGTGCE
jgi:hypothetical protein